MSCPYFIAKTFAHITGGLMITGLSARYPVAYTWLQTKLQSIPVLASLLWLAATLLITFVLVGLPANSPFKYALAILFALVLGQISGQLVKDLDETNRLADVVLLTTGVFLGMVGIGTADRQNLLGFGPYLLGGLVGLIVTQLVLMVVRAVRGITTQQAGLVGDVLSMLGIGLFAAFTAYDTQVLKEKARLCTGNPDYVDASLGLFLDFLNLFTNFGHLSR